MTRHRFGHYLLAPKRQRVLKRCIYLDAETTVTRRDQWSADPTLKLHPHDLRLVNACVRDLAPDGRSYRQIARGEFWLKAEGGDYPSPDALAKAFWTWITVFATKGHGRGPRKKKATTFPQVRTTYLFGHNVGYDYGVTNGDIWLRKLGWKVEKPYNEGPVFILRAHNKAKQHLVIYSTTNWWTGSVAMLGEAFHLPKLDAGEAAQTRDIALLREYCARDVDIVWTAMEGFVDFLNEHDFGALCATISSQAMSIFRRKFMHSEIWVHTVAEATAVERAAYDGGRADIFMQGVYPNPLYKLDKTSLYPSMMVKRRVPTRLTGVHRDWTVQHLEERLDEGDLVIAIVDVEVTEPCIPVKDGKLLFPIGRMHTALCSPELQLARRHGRILAVHKVTTYEGEVAFDSFVAVLYRERQKYPSGTPQNQMCKSLMNNLSGKWGQLSTEWEECALEGHAPGTSPVVVRDREDNVLSYPGEFPPFDVAVPQQVYFDPDGKTWLLDMYHGICYAASQTREEGYNAFPAVIAFITSYARVEMWRVMEIAGRDHIMMMDTDSLIVDTIGYINLLHAGEIHESLLGKLKTEGYDDGSGRILDDAVRAKAVKAKERIDERAPEFNAPKDYRLCGIVRHKGVPKQAELGSDEKGRPVARYTVWPSPKGYLHAGNKTYATRDIEKTLTPNYNKSLVDASTGRCVPFAYDVCAACHNNVNTSLVLMGRITHDCGPTRDIPQRVTARS